jgi:hypothetical protein
MQNGHTNNVAVVLVVYQKDLCPYEEISLRQCLKVFNNRTVYIVKPASLDLSSFNFIDHKIEFKSFPDHFFRNTGTYSRMLLSAPFYKEFSSHKYILICQTDAFVFNDDLDKWCNTGYDYMGAPWFEGFTHKEGEGKFVGVGNGGFSLRNIAAHLKVLHSFSYITSFRDNWKSRFVERRFGRNPFLQAGGLILDHTIRNNSYSFGDLICQNILNGSKGLHLKMRQHLPSKCNHVGFTS